MSLDPEFWSDVFTNFHASAWSPEEPRTVLIAKDEQSPSGLIEIARLAKKFGFVKAGEFSSAILYREHPSAVNRRLRMLSPLP